jgi:soluble lytic murein transglycosylase-like protein
MRLMMWIWLFAAVSALAQTAPVTGTVAPAKDPGPVSLTPVGSVLAPQAQPPPAAPAVGRMWEAIAKQRQSVRRQAELLDTWMLPFEGPRYVDTPCDPIDDAVVAPIVDGAAQSQKVDPKLLRAVIDQESGFHPCAQSSRGAGGLMQLMPETASQFSVRDVFDPRENIEAGTKYLKHLLDRYNGDLPRALAAYNAGPARVDQVGGIPEIPETREYVDAILSKLRSKDPDPSKNPKPKTAAK